jgi:aryl-alcohol dehydrogenase-like predicted oxidoreductase
VILPSQIEIRSVRGGVVSLPRIALGCGSFGGLGSQPQLFGQGMTDDEAAALMDAAWELGITHFDTADAYGGGRSESAIGRWMSSRGVRPTLTTKTFNPMAAGADHGLAPDRIARQLPTSLERLGVDRIELYLAHDYDAAVPLAESIGALESLRTAGLIDAYGVSNFDAAQLARAAAAGRPAAVQNDYSLLHRDDEARVIPLCAEHDVAYLVYSPLSGGWLTGKYRRDAGYPAGSRMSQFPDPYERLASDSTFTALERLEQYAAAHGRSMAGLALGWLLADDRIAQIVVGPSRPEHLAPVAEALAEPLTAEQRDEISAIFPALGD